MGEWWKSKIRRESGREREEEKIKFPVKMNQRKRENGREKKI
jgi:hypothetical protein